jgi:hypothetical protein
VLKVNNEAATAGNGATIIAKVSAAMPARVTWEIEMDMGALHRLHPPSRRFWIQLGGLLFFVVGMVAL